MQERLITLGCGIRAILAPCQAESVALGIFVGSGSRHESQSDAGISHLIEHMLFKGTPTRSAVDISRAIEGRGGNFNAFTGEETTCFFAHVPDEYWKEAVDILADMFLNATFPEDEFDREKSVVVEEIRMYKDDPDSVADENLQRSLFPMHPLGSPVAGTEETVMAMTSERLRAYLETHYLASNTVFSMSGAFDSDEAAKYLERAFASLSRPGEMPVATKAHPAAQPVIEEVKVAKSDISQVKLSIGWRSFGLEDEIPGLPFKPRYTASVLDAVLGRGMSSRLFEEVREKRGLAYSIGSHWQLFDEVGMATISAGLSAANVDLALGTIYREIERVCTKPVPLAELNRTKEFLTGNFRLSHERVTSKMIFHGATCLVFNRLVPSAEQVEAVRAVTPDDILAVARHVFIDANRSVSFVVPR